MTSNCRKRGFTLIELLVVIAIIALLIGILLPALGRARKNAQQLKDGTQVRGIMQAKLNHAADNAGKFPIPQDLDRFNMTIKSYNYKNNSGNMYSIMIWTQSITPELCISPAEANSLFRVMSDYEYSRPKGAPSNGENALWDPRFSGSVKHDFQGQGVLDPPPTVGTSGYYSNVSYAHSPLAGARFSNWANTLSSSTAIVANRGPVYEETQTPAAGEAWTLADDDSGIGSATLFIHGTETAWEGNICYGDGHVSFENQPDPEAGTFTDRQSSQDNPVHQRDNLFVDETNEGTAAAATAEGTTRRNAVLRLWSKGINTKEPFNAQMHITISAGGSAGEFVWADGLL